MKKYVFALVASALMIPVVGTASAQEAKLAERLVETAGVQPGDLVVVFGGKHMMDLVEDVSMAASMRGGRTQMLVSSDRVTANFWKEVPVEYLQQKYALADWIDRVDIWIGLPGTEDPAIFDNIPEERFALAQKSNQEWVEYLNSTDVKGVFVSYPTKAQAARNRVDYETLLDMHKKALAADYGQIASRASKLAEMLNDAETVTVTSAAGTDLTFKVGDRMVLKSDGIVSEDEMGSGLIMGRFASLPDGQVEVAPIETSATGVVVIPTMQCDDKDVTGVRMRFENGQMKDFTAEKNGACVRETLEPYGGHKDRFGYFSIGLNPAFRVMEDGGARYRVGDAAGMVWIGVGQNDWYGGENKVTGFMGLPLSNATVKIGDVVVVKDGAIVEKLFM